MLQIMFSLSSSQTSRCLVLASLLDRACSEHSDDNNTASNQSNVTFILFFFKISFVSGN